MAPFVLVTERLLLDQPGSRDVDDIALYCSDPIFETFMVLPWPYRREHAAYFVDEFVPQGWAADREWTWAVRAGAGLPLLGVVGVRLDSGMVGYWLGAPHRGRGLMAEALRAVIGAVFDRGARRELLWECVVGNQASLGVARGAGFRFAGVGPSIIAARDGTSRDSWTGVLSSDEDRQPKEGWPVLRP